MEEKELNYEEIVKDIERSTGMPSYWKKIVLNLINCQKTEIERLTGELFTEKRSHSTMAIYEIELKKADKENAELKKQVDELKNREIKPLIVQCHATALETCPKVEQAVKDKAKEVWNRAYRIACNTRGEITEQSIKEIAKREYGVEVGE